VKELRPPNKFIECKILKTSSFICMLQIMHNNNNNNNFLGQLYKSKSKLLSIFTILLGVLLILVYKNRKKESTTSNFYLDSNSQVQKQQQPDLPECNPINVNYSQF